MRLEQARQALEDLRMLDGYYARISQEASEQASMYEMAPDAEMYVEEQHGRAQQAHEQALQETKDWARQLLRDPHLEDANPIEAERWQDVIEACRQLVGGTVPEGEFPTHALWEAVNRFSGRPAPKLAEIDLDLMPF